MLRKLLVTLALAVAGCTAPAAGAPAHDHAPASEPPEDSASSDGPDAPSDKTPATTTVPAAAGLDPKDAQAFDAFVTSHMQSARIPGITLAILRQGQLAYAHAYGLADVATGKAMTTDTTIEVASISKTITGVSLMQLAAAGKVTLDGDVSAYLPKPLRNPRFPAAAITLRHLLTHTSSLVSNDDTLGVREGVDYPSTLASTVASYFYHGGAAYSQANFGSSAPGTRMDYCNICLALVGYVVERASNMPFEAYTKAHVFTPLAMTSTTWFLSESDRSRLATPYAIDPDSGEQSAASQLGLPDWPAGSVKTTPTDYARFLAAVASDGVAGTTRLLAKSSIDEMVRVQLPAAADDQGLVFFASHRGTLPAPVWGHDGSLTGIASVMDFAPGTGNGAIVFSNTDWPESFTPEPALLSIETRALELAMQR